jgi:hypothetical protein
MGVPWNEGDFAYSLYTSLDKVEYLYENGCPHKDHNTVCGNDMQAYLHRKKILTGPHCRRYHCTFCLEEMKEEMRELWQMEEIRYDNFIQWLPYEVLDDIIPLIDYRGAIRKVNTGYSGFICPPMSTEGEPCGMVKELNIRCNLD